MKPPPSFFRLKLLRSHVKISPIEGKPYHVVNERIWDVKKTVLQASVLLAWLVLCIGAVHIVNRLLDLPFRSTNDTLHKNGSSFTLDFLIPSGTHIDEKATIRQIIRTRTAQKTSTYEGMLQTATEIIPTKYRYIANLIIFLFWTFMFMTVLRVFTFVGYSRALRTSLLFGGCVYYFMPDFSPGRIDDIVFVVVAVLIIIMSAALKRRRKRRARESENLLDSTEPAS